MRCFATLLLSGSVLCPSAAFAQGTPVYPPHKILPVTPEPVEVTVTLQEAFETKGRVFMSSASRINIAVYYGIVALPEQGQLVLVECTGGHQPPAECRAMAQFKGTSASADAVSFYGSRYGPKVWLTTNTSVFMCDFSRAMHPIRTWENCDKLADLPVPDGNAKAPSITAAAQLVSTGRSSIAWFALPKSMTGHKTSRIYKCRDFDQRTQGCVFWDETYSDVLAISADMQKNRGVDLWVTTERSIIRCESSTQPDSCYPVWQLPPNAPSGLTIQGD